ncbi:MAG: YcaQ family DNA glycosylase, partial [Chloroflexi bacterium]|nr:YcaQ family DNA glycosylase [Chloroflexota bacterium]
MLTRGNKKESGAVYLLSALRAIALHAQGLAQATYADRPTDGDRLYELIRQIGCVQIDTLQVVHRSQYLTLWSRVGNYDTSELDDLLSGNGVAEDRRLFEYWLHAACLIPIELYRHRMPLMRLFREGKVGWRRDWARRPENARLIEQTLEHVRTNGAVRVSDFDNPEKGKGAGWWEWKPAKRALEHLYDCGHLTIADRVRFQRVYDLPERVLPGQTDTTEPELEESHRYLLEQSMMSLGVCKPMQVCDYIHMKRTVARPFIEELVANGTFVEIKGRLLDGEVGTLVVHRDKLPELEMAADGEIASDRTTFLSPFDNLFWAKDRDEEFWGFRQILEAYKPAPKRDWGYFCLPILFKDRLVGRFDPSLDRKSGTLRLKRLYLEPGVEPNEDLVSAVAGAMRDFLAFHD